mmetsp:Transcript_4794/g.7830  ORF Transcript_4794/g.7830 Transcript_4794/m.7830 type:complete len:532 (+) Transcript_4794:70-1665(+)
MDVEDSDADRKRPSSSSQASSAATRSSSMKTAAKKVNIHRFDYIPMRLTEQERKLLETLENALEVCEYTDVVDVTFSHTRKSKLSRILESLVDVLSISCGLLMANNLTKGEQLIGGKTLNDNVPLFTTLFEVGRRYKVMNPGKMRDTYGKLMYIIMDTESYNIKTELKISFLKPILTVSRFLTEKGCADILTDPLWTEATASIQDVDDVRGENKTKQELAAEVKAKAQAEQQLKQKYTSDNLSEEELQRVIDSIADNEAYLTFNRSPVKRIISILKDSFDPKSPPEAPQFSLRLQGKPRGSGSNKLFSGFSSLYGSGFSSSFSGGGACLNHDHATQFKFVLQSFTLWCEIMTHMPKLWLLADIDMTHEAYRLVDTGQGYQRLQQCPRVRQEMSRILSSVQAQCGSWVGLAVVHLGDRDVPNALTFIDKYTQVPRILAPIVQCIETLPQLVEDRAFHAYVSQEWGSIEGLRMQILSDFFKHGFDGSGDDGGSCIDGRLTSAWNWCSKLHKKPYYYVFMFTGFQGFDGDWKEN